MPPLTTEGELAITWVGHSTVLVEMDGGAFLTDPNFSQRVKILPRYGRPGLEIDDLPRLDMVLVSHAHLDHLDLPSLEKLHAPLFLAPPRVGEVFRAKVSGEVRELGSGEEACTGPFRVRAIPVRHPFTARWGWDLFRGVVGFVIAGGADRPGHRVLFVGDSAYSPEIAQSVAGQAVDLAILPIGAFWPRFIFGRYHMDPEGALHIFEDTGARFLLPVHWGDFRLTLENPMTPMRILREAVRRRGLEGRVLFPKKGERLILRP